MIDCFPIFIYIYIYLHRVLSKNNGRNLTDNYSDNWRCLIENKIIIVQAEKNKIHAIIH